MVKLPSADEDCRSRKFSLAAASSKIGIKGSPLELGSVVLGKSLEPNEGLRLRFENGSVLVDFPSGAAEALLSRPSDVKDAKGVALSSSVPAGRIGLGGSLRLTSMPTQDFNGWLHSPVGPVFGTAKSPFRLYWEQLELSASQQWLAAAGLRPSKEQESLDGDSTGELSLQGSFNDSSMTSAAAANPLPLTAEFRLDQLNFFKKKTPANLNRALTEETLSAVEQVAGSNTTEPLERRLSLTEPLDITYSQKGKERWLDSKAFRFNLSQGPKDTKIGSFSGEFHVPIQCVTPKGSSKPSIFHFEIEEMPVDRLTALFPFLGAGSGTIHRLSLDGIGDALRPNLHAQLQLGPSQIGRLNLAKVDGDIYGLPLRKGKYELLFASGSAPNPSVANSTAVPQFDIFLGKAPTSAEIAKRTAAGASPVYGGLSQRQRVSSPASVLDEGAALSFSGLRPTAKDSQPFCQRYTLSPSQC